MLYWYSISCQGWVRSSLGGKKIEFCINDRNKTTNKQIKKTKKIPKLNNKTKTNQTKKKPETKTNKQKIPEQNKTKN